MKRKFIYDEELYPSKAREYVTRVLLVTGMTIAAMGIGQCMKEPRQAPTPVAVKASKVETQIHAAFEKAGSPVPQQMTQACMKTKNPKLMESVAIVESEGTPWAKGKAGERGAWQVITKEHGQVSDHDDASVKNFRGKLPHPFNAAVDVADSFGHKGASVIAKLPVQ